MADPRYIPRFADPAFFRHTRQLLRQMQQSVLQLRERPQDELSLLRLRQSVETLHDAAQQCSCDLVVLSAAQIDAVLFRLESEVRMPDAALCTRLMQCCDLCAVALWQAETRPQTPAFREMLLTDLGHALQHLLIYLPEPQAAAFSQALQCCRDQSQQQPKARLLRLPLRKLRREGDLETALSSLQSLGTVLHSESENGQALCLEFLPHGPSEEAQLEQWLQQWPSEDTQLQTS